MWLVNARDVKNVPGRPKTDKLDAVWLAKLNERGMVRPSFVPPTEIRQLRDYTRMRSDLTGDRARQIQRLEKLLEDALIKLSAVATNTPRCPLTLTIFRLGTTRVSRAYFMSLVGDLPTARAPARV